MLSFPVGSKPPLPKVHRSLDLDELSASSQLACSTAHFDIGLVHPIDSHKPSRRIMEATTETKGSIHRRLEEETNTAAKNDHM